MMMKSVSFDSKVKIHHMHAWSFAHREARKSNGFVSDRQRFETRKQLLEVQLAKIGFFSKKIKKMSISWTIYIPRSPN